MTALMLLWLWHRLAASAPVGPIAWEPPYAVDAVSKKGKKKKKKTLCIVYLKFKFNQISCLFFFFFLAKSGNHAPTLSIPLASFIALITM